MKHLCPTNSHLPTKQEWKILHFLVKGFCNKQIAAVLNISIKTVEKHHQKLNKKLKANCEYALLKNSIELRMVECPFDCPYKANDSFKPQIKKGHIEYANEKI